jgi:hypothetical protein
MEAGFNPAIRAAGLVASPCARGAGFDAAVSNPHRPFAQSQATRKGLAGSTSRPVRFLFRSAMSDSERPNGNFVRARGRVFSADAATRAFVASCPRARFKLITSRLASAASRSPRKQISSRRW